MNTVLFVNSTIGFSEKLFLIFVQVVHVPYMVSKGLSVLKSDSNIQKSDIWYGRLFKSEKLNRENDYMGTSYGFDKFSVYLHFKQA